MSRTKDNTFLAMMLIILALGLLAAAQRYIDSFPFSPPHIKSPPYVWEGQCQEIKYTKGIVSCDCVNDQYKISSWRMIKYGINTQRSLGLYRVGNDLLELTEDFSNQCRAKSIYRNVFYQK